MMNEFKRMQELAGLLTEIRIVPANYTQLFQSVPDNTSLWKINNFPSPKTDAPLDDPNVFKIINLIYTHDFNEEFNPNDEAAYAEDINDNINKLSSYNIVYIHTTGDGFLVFVNDLGEFSEGYKTEEDWGVEDWKQVM